MDATIVIPVFNQLHYTRQCLESLNATGCDDSMIVVVDNASTDGTAEYLAGRPKLHVITNPENRACAAAWNQGYAVRQSPWTVFLNNDTLLTSGWLEKLARFARQSAAAIVCPARTDGDLDYDLESHARAFTEKMKAVQRRDMAHGVCFMVAREVIEKIGNFDENFRKGGNEDLDFFWRAQRAGFKLAISGCAYIHHFGSVTQLALIAERGRTRDETVGYFRRKWQIGWVRRKWLMVSRRSLAAWRRTGERLRYGHCLVEKRKGGKIYYR
ncbi:MAG: glycosyltransferase family 2 protein [Verrucomicrobiae bacterium]|nr:glycosyltransferase family 2 protein [Verrucomicrobiae bacterium]